MLPLQKVWQSARLRKWKTIQQEMWKNQQKLKLPVLSKELMVVMTGIKDHVELLVAVRQNAGSRVRVQAEENQQVGQEDRVVVDVGTAQGDLGEACADLVTHADVGAALGDEHADQGGDECDGRARHGHSSSTNPGSG